MLILNFSHPLTEPQLARAAELAAQPVDAVFNIPVQFDTTLPFAPQVEELVNHIPLTPRQLQTEPILVVLPALNFIAALLLADLHGRMGYFPAVLRLRPVPGSTPPAFEAAEILNLQQIRENARTTRRLDENQSD